MRVIMSKYVGLGLCIGERGVSVRRVSRGIFKLVEGDS